MKRITALTNGGYPVSVMPTGQSVHTESKNRFDSLLYKADNSNLDPLLLEGYKPLNDIRLLSRIGINNVGQQPGEVT